MAGTMYVFLVFLWTICYGYVPLSSTARTGGYLEDVFDAGVSWTCQYQSLILLSEKGGEYNKSVGFYLAGDLVVESLWRNNDERLLKLELQKPQIHIRSQKASLSQGFKTHSSNLDALQNKPFLLHWNAGRVGEIYLAEGEATALANIKKGIASLFQFQLEDGAANETDSSGYCQVTYNTETAPTYTKLKESCTNSDLPYLTNPDDILGTQVKSLRISSYQINEDGRFPSKIESNERHELFPMSKEDIGAQLEAQQVLTLKDSSSAEQVNADAFSDALVEVSNKEGIVFTETSLLTQRDTVSAEELPSFSKVVGDYREKLKADKLGSLESAKALSRLVNIARRSSKEEILSVLKSKKNQPILHQLYDVLGYVQTLNAHESVMKKLHFEKNNHEDLSERYLWALSISSQPNPDIILDLLKRYNKATDLPPKVKDTLVLSLGAMAYRLSKLPYATSNKAHHAVEESLLHGLKSPKEEDRFLFLRALRNLRSQNTIPTLLQIIKEGSRKEGVLAWKALRAQDPFQWDKSVLAVAKKTFFTLDRRHDSSSRTLALEIILQSNPSLDTLKELVYHLISADPAFEVKQYTMQVAAMIGEKNPEFGEKIMKFIKSDPRLNNYNVLAQRGLSTALSRSFLTSSSSNGSLVTIQEMNSGIVKSGTVNVVLEKGNTANDIFNLGIFCGGLSSFFSSNDEEADDESATAGMELAVLGTFIRPFTFFSSQGELMGHVFSGTASERTTAFQALALLHDHHEYLRLGNGFVAEFNVKGAASFDLAGNIEISLWNRNAKSLVEKMAGISLAGYINVDASFVKSKVEFGATVEPKLHLNTDLDFYTGTKLCMRLSQPDTTYRYYVHKSERIPGSKYKLRISKSRTYQIPGRTYALNKKNDNMCSEIFN